MTALFTDTHHSTLLGLSFAAVIQFLFIASIGGAAGVGVGELIRSRAGIKDDIAKLLRIGRWIPVIVLWCIPVVNAFPVWLTVVLPIVLFVTTVGVAMAALHDHIHRSSLLGPDRQAVLRSALRTALTQALVVWLFSQTMMSGAGWHWYAKDSRALLSALLIGIVLFIVDRVFRSNFSKCSSACATIILEELKPAGRGMLFRSSTLAVALMFVWWILAAAGLEDSISSPVSFLASLYQLVAKNELWGDLSWSSIEIFGGLFFAAILGIALNFIVPKPSVWTSLFFTGLPLTFITPLMAWMAFPGWPFQWGIAPKIIGVMLLSVFPFFRAYWGLRDRSLGLRLILGVDHALPFAFVAMLFMESMASIKGLGFTLTQASAVAQTRPEGLAVVAVIVGLLFGYSFILRCVARYGYRTEILMD